MEVLATETVGLFPRGKGWAAAEDGRSAFDGARPVNTSGGHLSRGHPPEATPLNDIVEACTQVLWQAGKRKVRGPGVGPDGVGGGQLQRRTGAYPGGWRVTESTVSLKLMRRPGARPFPLRISTFTRPFWDALAAGRLISTRFGRRGRISLPPKPLCRSCWSEEIDWVDLRPSGTLYSFTRDRVVPRAFLADALYEMGIVDLSDGVRLMCRLLDVDADADTAIAGPCGWSW